jgi:nicotianamine synthase
MFAENLPSAHITNIDRDPSAIHISSALATHLGYNNMFFLHENATSLTSLLSFDVVCLAALVGMSSLEKTQILQNISSRMKEGGLLCVRSAVGLRGVLYPVIEFDDEIAQCGLEMVVEIRPWNHIVNSTLVMKVVR